MKSGVLYSDVLLFSHETKYCVVHLFLAYESFEPNDKLMLCHVNFPEVVELKCILHPAVEICQKLFKFCI